MPNEITVAGQPLLITFLPAADNHTKIKFDHYQSYVFTGRADWKKQMPAAIRKQFSPYLVKRTHELAQQFGFDVKKIVIREQSTRWGSCSSTGTLSLNWRLLLAPTVVSDYVIIHELCHIKEMNHSKSFWALVAQFMPDYKRHKLWLKVNGREIMRVLA